MCRVPLGSRGVGCVIVGLLLAGAARGDVTLRWKFKPGETIHYVADQKIVQNMAAGNQPMKITVSQTMDILQKIDAVDNEGNAAMTQTINRIHMKMDGAQGTTDFDSASEKEPEGIAKMMAPMLKAMVNKPFKVKMSPRGEILSMKLPEGLSEKMGGALGGMFSEDSMKQLASVAVLPEEAVAPEKTWTHKATIKNPMVGSQTVQSTFRYLGTEEHAGKKLEKIGVTVDMKFDAKDSKIAVEIKKQDSRGTIWFDNAAGRLTQSAIQTKMTMAINVGGTAIEQNMEMNQTFKLAPPGAAVKTEKTEAK